MSRAGALEKGIAEGARIDKWLWTVRIFKTRALATAACRAGRVTVDSREAKPARLLSAGQTIVVRDGLATRTFRVEAFPLSRVGAKVVDTFRTDLTPPTEPNLLAPSGVLQLLARARDHDGGRPTKKDRRDFLKYFS